MGVLDSDAELKKLADLRKLHFDVDGRDLLAVGERCPLGHGDGDDLNALARTLGAHGLEINQLHGDVILPELALALDSHSHHLIAQQGAL